VKLKAIDFGTCIGVDSTFTTIYVNLASGFAGIDQTMCYRAGTTLIAGGGVKYLWSTLSGNTSTLAKPVVIPEDDTQYFVSITDINGCVKKDTVNVAVIPGIDLQYDYSKNYDCYGRPQLKVENLTESEFPTFFDFGDGVTSDLPSLEHVYENDGTYAVRLVGTRDGCVYEKRTDVPIYTLLVPNVFTPDEFPENNFFQILYGGRPINESLKASLLVYNRWGGLVFKSDDYRNDWNASNVNSGVYFYDLIVENETACKGWVNVIK